MTGYKPGAAKSVDEYAKLDAEDESLARWKASLGNVPGAATSGSGPKVRVATYAYLALYNCHTQVTILSLELASPTLPAGKHLVMNLQDHAQIASLKKNPITIKEGVEFKWVIVLNSYCAKY